MLDPAATDPDCLMALIDAVDTNPILSEEQRKDALVTLGHLIQIVINLDEEQLRLKGLEVNHYG